MPQTKEETIASYRESLERCGVDTSAWWDRQLGLSLLAMAASMAWEKAVGDEAELAWWQDAAVAGAEWL
jgi:hypothetical protein